MDKPNFQLLTKRRLERESRAYLLTKSVASTSAPTASLCALESSPSLPVFDFDSVVLDNTDVPTFVLAVVELQFRYGLRISEVLNITVNDISPSGSILIHALKGSNDRIVEPVTFRKFWLSSFQSLLPLKNIYSRYFFYRIYKQKGWYDKFGSSSLNSVTHYFRHIKALTVHSEFSNIAITSSALGHKSIKSTLYYINEDKK